jgi:hypothetical protein
MNDNFINLQKNLVLNRLTSISYLQNLDKASPFYGLFDYTYWRDKKTSFPDSRFQEVTLTFVLAELCKVKPICNDTIHPIVTASIAAVKRIQNSDGSFDEWYEGDRGIAASTYIGINLLLLKEFYSPINLSIKKDIDEICIKLVNFLKKRDDLIKINHQAALIYFFCLVEKNLSFPNPFDFKSILNQKLTALIEKQRSDGWFHEISGKDIGYSFLLLDYLCLSNFCKPNLVDDTIITKLYKNAISFLEDDLTHDKAVGFCYNGYFGSISTIYLSNRNNSAQHILQKMINETASINTVTEYLNDELRFCRWSYLPLLADHYLKKTAISIDPLLSKSNIDIFTDHIANDKSLISKKFGTIKILASPFNGGFLKVILENGRSITFRKAWLQNKGALYSTQGYETRNVQITGSKIIYDLPIRKVNFFEPSPYLMALITYLCKSEKMSRAIRYTADCYRKLFKTTLNQSEAPLIEKLSKSINGILIINILSDKVFINFIHAKNSISENVLFDFNTAPSKYKVKTSNDGKNIIRSFKFTL